MQKALLIFSSILLGSFFTIGHQFTYIIRYNLMVMLFFSFLAIRIDLKGITFNHFKIVLANVLLPIILYGLLQWLNQDWASIAFVLAIAPTAVAATVIAEIMNKKVAVVTFSILMTNISIALLLPFLLPLVLEVSQKISVIDLLLPILSLIFIPFLSSQFLRQYFKKLTVKLLSFNFITFPLFLLNVFVACGNASYFIQHNENINIQQLLGIFVLTSIVCILQFRLGQFIGKKDAPIEFSLALGRKNTMLGLWLALTYFNPIVALGPICYIVIQNAYNSFQIWQIEKAKS